MGFVVYPGSPRCLADISVFAEIPKILSSLWKKKNEKKKTQKIFDFEFLIFFLFQWVQGFQALILVTIEGF